MGILENQGRSVISQNAVPQSTIGAVIGSVNTSAFLVTYLVRPSATSSSNGHQTILCHSYWRCAACALASEAFMP